MANTLQAKILDISYNKDNNVFYMKLYNMEKNETVTCIIKASEWGVTSDVPNDIVQDFCDKMRGQTKILNVEYDSQTLSSLGSENVSEQQVEDVNNNMDRFPIREAMEYMEHQERKNNGS